MNYTLDSLLDNLQPRGWQPGLKAGRPLQKENERLIIAPEHVVDKLSIIRDHLQDEEYAAAVVEN